MHRIKLNDQELPVNFGTSAIMRVEELTGVPFYKFIFSLIPTDIKQGENEENVTQFAIDILQSTGVGDMAKILYAGLYGGAKKEGKPLDMTFDDLIDELDQCDEILTPLSQALFLAFESLPKGDGKSKGKKKEVNPI